MSESLTGPDESTDVDVRTTTTVSASSASVPKSETKETVNNTGESFISFIQQAQRAPSVSPACSTFIETLERVVGKYDLKYCEINTGTCSGCVVYSEKKSNKGKSYGVILAFAPSSLTFSKRSVSERIEELYNSYKLKVSADPKTSSNAPGILTGYVVDESSTVNSAERFVNCIYNVINTAINEDNGCINKSSFGSNDGKNPLYVSTKSEHFRSFIRNVNPFGFQERDDIGFVAGYPKPNCPQTEFFDIKPETHNILFAVTGYTQFIRNDQYFGSFQQNQKLIQPIVHITSIISETPSIVLLPAAVAIAAVTFITNKVWANPYLMINGKEEMNIGNLIISSAPDGSLSSYSSDTPSNAENTIQQFCAEPMLAIDRTNGRYSLIGIDAIFDYRINDKLHTILNTLKDFYPDINVADNTDLTCNTFEEYTGSITDNNVVKDSRYGDFLHLVKRHSDIMSLLSFLNQPNDPFVHLQQLMDLGFPVSNLYKTKTTILTFKLVSMFNHISPYYNIDINSGYRFNRSFTGLSNVGGLNTIQQKPLVNTNLGTFYNNSTGIYTQR